MRRLIVPVVTLAAVLGGCSREPDFDERYNSASRTIVERAKAIDSQIAATGVAADGDVEPDPVAN
jgi:PBP1b-binding outer membrane lipoprotein LpoB